MPAEWERQACVWVTRPHDESTWPGCMNEALEQFEAMTAAIGATTEVRDTAQLDIPTNDSWIRDYGPVFVVDEKVDALKCHDFSFNCWGGKYWPFDADDVVPQRIAQRVGPGVDVWVHDFVLEGGSIDVNGVGSVMTTEQCLLHPARNPRMSREQIEGMLHAALGTRHVIWLPGGIDGDDTDGHIDDVARFVSPMAVLAVRAPEAHPDHLGMERNWLALEAARDQDGNRLELIALPAPEPMHFDYPADEFGIGGRKPLPASYANFLISNRAAIVPTFGQASDDEALKVIEGALPGYRVEGVRCEWLIVGLGAVHCLTQQQPNTHPINLWPTSM